MGSVTSHVDYALRPCYFLVFFFFFVFFFQFINLVTTFSHSRLLFSADMVACSADIPISATWLGKEIKERRKGNSGFGCLF